MNPNMSSLDSLYNLSAFFDENTRAQLRATGLLRVINHDNSALRSTGRRGFFEQDSDKVSSKNSPFPVSNSAMRKTLRSWGFSVGSRGRLSATHLAEYNRRTA